MVAKAKEIADGRMGETGIGLCVGTAAGFLCKQAQNMVVNTALVGGAVACGACISGWAKPDDLLKQAEVIGERAKAQATETVGMLGNLLKFDANGDGEANLAETRITLSKFAHRHAGLTAGVMGGALLGYKLG